MRDLIFLDGVLDVTTGKFMARVAADPKPGQYVWDGDALVFSPEDSSHDIRRVPPRYFRITIVDEDS